MTTRKIVTLKVTDPTPSDYLGHLGDITYRDGFLYYHDGVTPGGDAISGGGGGGPTSWASVTGKPTFAAVATSGSYADLTGKPTLFSGNYADLVGKPTLATVATSGSYNDLTDTPTLTTGPQGPKGDTGATGATGATGPAGPAGPAGADGADGAQGPQGPQGLTGDKGEPGEPGPQGETGSQGPAGPKGDQGDKGDTGEPGATGPMGATGAQGEPGVGVPAGGTTGQILAKVDGTDYNTEWVNQASGFSGAYADLTGKPSIPEDISDLTDTGGLLGSGSTNEITNTDGISTYSVSVATSGVVTMNTARGTIEFGAMPEVGGPSHLHIMKPELTTGVDLYFGDDYNYVLQRGTAYGSDPAYGVEIGTNDRSGGSQNSWRFGTDGVLTLPASGDIVDSNGFTVLGAGSSDSIVNGSYSLTVQPQGHITVPTSQYSTAQIFSQGGVDLYIGTLDSGNYWQFRTGGTLTFPDGTSQTTAFTGSVDWTDVTNQPTLFSGSYTDLTNKPTVLAIAPQWTANHTLLPGGANTRYLIGDAVYDSGNIYVANYENESIPISDTTYWTNIGTGNRLNIDGRDIPNITYDQLNNKPTLFDGAYSSLTGTPALFSGDYADLTNKPTLFDGAYSSLTGSPSLSTVATSGDYDDLTNKPTIRIAVASGSGPGGNNQADSLALAGLNPTENIPSTWGGDLILQGGAGGANGDLYGEVRIKSGTVGANYEWHFTTDKKIKLPAGGDIVDSTDTSVLFSGSYTDLTNKPALATVATSGDYDDLTNKPTSAALVDITNTNGLTTVYYPTFVESRTDEQALRADVDLSYRTDTNTLTVGNITSSGTVSAANITLNGQTIQAIGATTVTTGEVVGNNNVSVGSIGPSGSAVGYMSVPLPSAGTWKLTIIIRGDNGAGNNGIGFGLYDGNNNPVANSACIIQYNNDGGDQGVGTTSTVVTTTGAETYTVRIWGLAASGTPKVYSDTSGYSKVLYEKLDQAVALSAITSLTTTGNVDVGGNLEVTGTSNSVVMKASGLVNNGVDVTLGNLRARLAGSGNRSLQVSTVSGTYSVYGSGTFNAGSAGSNTINAGAPLTITTTPQYLASGLNLNTAGYTDTWMIMDTGNTIAWRISLILGGAYNNNMISIERLV